jgi:hypothetical protein
LSAAQKQEVEAALDGFKVAENELRIFRYQFVLNYLSKPNNKERMRYLMLVYPQESSFRATVF